MPALRPTLRGELSNQLARSPHEPKPGPIRAFGLLSGHSACCQARAGKETPLSGSLLGQLGIRQRPDSVRHADGSGVEGLSGERPRASIDPGRSLFPGSAFLSTAVPLTAQSAGAATGPDSRRTPPGPLQHPGGSSPLGTLPDSPATPLRRPSNARLRPAQTVGVAGHPAPGTPARPESRDQPRPPRRQHE